MRVRPYDDDANLQTSDVVCLAQPGPAGDRLNLAAPQERLTAEGIDTRIGYVTDDIASAEPDDIDERRGIAGTFAVYKIGGAAADSGADLDTVERLMRAANGATFSFGVAFDGCTFPGQSHPLFTVEDGQMELGLGIHGEPGVTSVPSMSAKELAEVLVDSVLAERPTAAGDRAAAIVNGLGATKYEELFLLYGHVHERLVEAGVVPVLAEVGELVTSLDMAACSLSLTWLGDELEEFWAAPADTVAFRRGDTGGGAVFEAAGTVSTMEADSVTEEAASEDSLAAAGLAREMLAAMAEVVVENEEELGRIDAVAGDGDHGVGMSRGLRGAVAAANATHGGVATVLRAAGDAFGDEAGGTSGMLWGCLLTTIGESMGGTEVLSADEVAAAVRRGATELQRVGKADLGDKTMLDALLPFVDVLEVRLEGGEDLAMAWGSAADVAVEAAAATAPLVPRIGRARPLAERSIGTPDAGATSMGLVLAAAGRVLAAASSDR